MGGGQEGQRNREEEGGGGGREGDITPLMIFFWYISVSIPT